MFFLASTTDDRTRVCTATAAQAFGHLLSMTDSGLEPKVTDRRGQSVSFATLRRLADRAEPHPARRAVS